MASDLLRTIPRKVVQQDKGKISGSQSQRMRKDSLIRFSALILAILTVATIVFAAINFQKEGQFVTPDDGAWWLEQNGALVAQRVVPGGPAENAGIKAGDRLISARPASALEEHPIRNLAGLQKQLYRVGVLQKAVYGLERNGARFDARLILMPTDRSLFTGLRLIALIYLGIGVYVLFRRWTAPKSTHFYIFCLVSFVLYSFHYTGKLN